MSSASDSGPAPRARRRGGAVWTIARRDLLEHARSVRFLVLFALSTTLLPLGTYVNQLNVARERAEYDRLRTAGEQAAVIGIARFALRSPQSQLVEDDQDEALRALRPPEPMGALVRGVSEWLPRYWQFSPRAASAGPAAKDAGRDASLIGDLDLVFVGQVVLGLLAVLLTGDAVCGEKESGTLRAVLSAPVSRWQFLAGKFIGAAITLLLPLTLGLAASLAVLAWRDPAAVSGESLVRVAAAGAALVCFLLGYAALGLLVSAVTRQARTSIVILLVSWVLLTVIWPRAASLLAAGTFTTPSPQSVERAKLSTMESLNSERMARKLAAEGGAPAESASLAPGFVPRGAASEDDRTFFRRRRDALRQLDEDFSRRVRRQQQLARALARLSPASSVAFVLTDVAGTGELSSEEWERRVRAHQQLLESGFFDRVYGEELVQRAPGGVGLMARWRPLSPDDPRMPRYSTLPRFDYAPPSLLSVMRERALDLILLGMFGAFCFGAAWVAFQRYDVR